MLITKVIRGETRVLDAEAGRVSAIASTEARDRDGDVIRAEGWSLENFLAHPILLSSHNYGSVRNQIGEWEKLEVRGKKLQGVARYYIGEGNEEADWAFKLASKGRAAYSVGFIPDMAKAERLKDGYEFKGQELLEVSHVTVPSNPTALQMARSVAVPEVQAIIDEIMAEETEHIDSHDPPAVRAALKQLLREIIAETGDFGNALGAEGGAATPSHPSVPFNILDLIGGNHA